jgi:UDP-3-O-[3-hydroxymyristoyl] glucosamine N-acyltransferase
MYSNATLVKDNIVHSSTMIAHNCYIDIGSYVSAGVNIAGTTKIGKFCFLGLASVINDHIMIADQVTIGAGAYVRKSITHPGVYITQSLSDITKLK